MSSANPFPGLWPGAKKRRFLLPCVSKPPQRRCGRHPLLNRAVCTSTADGYLDSVYATGDFFQRRNCTVAISGAQTVL